MTLQKFSDKAFGSMFKTKLKNALFFPLVGLILISVYTVYGPFSEVIMLNGYERYGYMEGISIENVRYVLSGTLGSYGYDFISVSTFIYVVAIIAAILSAIMVFRDLSNKKTANVYYSLGFSRSKLFASTYLAGAVCVLGMVVIPFALSFIINAFSFGISKELLSALIFSVSCLCNVSLIAYTLSAIAMTLSGMLVEGIFFSFFLNGISPIFTFSCCLFSDGLLTGGGFVDVDSYYASFDNSFISAFVGKLSFLNNLSHSSREVNRLSCCLYTSDIDGYRNYLSAENWTTPDFIPLLVWSFILAGVIALSFFVFNRKKVENIGFFASCPALYRILFGTLTVGFSSLGCSAGRTITKGLTWLYVLIILAICLVITALVVLILTKLSRMKFKTEFRYFAFYSLAVVLFGAIFSTGFFGYQNRLPAPEKVAEVSITSFSSFNTDGGYDSELNGDSWGEVDSIIMDTFATNGDEPYSFVSKADIINIQELQKGLIEADNIKMAQNYKETKIGVKINIIYTMKNGKEISRSYYRITPELIDKYVSYKGVSEKIKLDMTEKLSYMISCINDNDDFYSDYVNKEFYTVFSKDFTTAHNVKLSEVQLYSLLQAYTKDLEKLSAKKVLAPKEKALGAIAIREDWNVLGEYDEVTDTETVEGKGSELEADTFNSNNHNSYQGDGYVVINENMTNTVKWAKDAGIYKYFANDYGKEIQSVEVTHNNTSTIKLDLAGRSYHNLMFCAKSFRLGDSYTQNYFSGNFARLYGSHYAIDLTDDEIRFLRENAHPSYLTTETGYFVRFATNEKTPIYSTVFIPDSKLTPELKIKLAQSNEDAEAYYEEAVTYVGREYMTTSVQ